MNFFFYKKTLRVSPDVLELVEESHENLITMEPYYPFTGKVRKLIVQEDPVVDSNLNLEDILTDSSPSPIISSPEASVMQEIEDMIANELMNGLDCGSVFVNM